MKVTDTFCASGQRLLDKLLPSTSKLPSLESMGFRLPPPASRRPARRNAPQHHEQRNIPAIRGTSRLGVHLRFGTIGIRLAAARASASNETFLNELIWRDFYQMILWHFPLAAKEPQTRLRPNSVA